jgi:Do/DeqQ family serine protease
MIRLEPVRCVLLFGVVIASLFAGAAAAEKVLPSLQADVQLSFAPLVKDAVPAVVNIFSRRVVQTIRSPFFDDPFFRHFFGGEFPHGWIDKRVKNALGSGVIVTPDGYVVTNHHVIQDSEEITVALSDRRQFAARVVLLDMRTDLAVLKIDVAGESLHYLEFGDSDALEVGDIVIAIGNPFGVGQTVTSGIVSALARTQVGAGDYRFFIQTDAAINPGNSGGALISMDGTVAGINTAIFSRSGGSIGIGFAIPANLVAVIVKGAIAGGRIMRPWLGASGQFVTAEIAEAIDLTRPGGVLVKRIFPTGPADRAGIEIGDVIHAVDGRDVADPAGLAYRVATREIGEDITLGLIRAGRARIVIAKLSALPEEPPRDLKTLAGRHPVAGATAANLSPALADELGIDTLAKGVILINVPRPSPARRFGLRAGDIIVAVNDRKITSVAELELMLSEDVRAWQIRLRRDDRVLSLRVQG